MTFNELHKIYMEQSNYTKGLNPTPDLKTSIKAFLIHLSRVYSSGFGAVVTALFSLPLGLFLAWFIGWVARWMWEVFLIGWN